MSRNIYAPQYHPQKIQKSNRNDNEKTKNSFNNKGNRKLKNIVSRNELQCDTLFASLHKLLFVSYRPKIVAISHF